MGLAMRKTGVSALEDHLGYWLRYVSNQVSHAFSLKVEARGVTVAEWVVMRELFERSVKPSALADSLGMTRGAISKLADRLEAKSLVARTADTTDRRYQTLALTEAGSALVPELSMLADRNDHEFFGDLHSADRANLQRILQDVVRQRGLRTVPID
jgi:DNA-binding MarR family transcriptional regulator